MIHINRKLIIRSRLDIFDVVWSDVPSILSDKIYPVIGLELEMAL
jgi:hypothetical protein